MKTLPIKTALIMIVAVMVMVTVLPVQADQLLQKKLEMAKAQLIKSQEELKKAQEELKKAQEEVTRKMRKKNKYKAQRTVNKAQEAVNKAQEEVNKLQEAVNKLQEAVNKPQEAVKQEVEKVAAKQAVRHMQRSQQAMIAKRLQVMSGNSSSRAGIGAGDTFPYGLWLQGVHTQTQQDALSSKQGSALPGFSANSNALTLGWDREIALTPGDHLVLGAAVTAGNTTIHSRGLENTANLDSYAVNIYGEWQHGQWATDAILGLGINQHHDQRYVGTSTQPLVADYQSDYASVRLLEGYTIARGAWSIKPLVGLDYTHVHTDQHQEKGAVSGLVTKATNEHTLEVGAGLAVQRAVTVAKGQLIPAAKVMAWYDVANQPVTVTSRSLAGASTWTVTEAQPPRTAWEADLNLSYVRNQSTLVAGYNRNQEAGFHSNNYYLQFKYYF